MNKSSHEEELRKIGEETKKTVGMVTLLRDTLGFEMSLLSSGGEKEEICIPYLDKDSSEKAVRIKHSASRPHFIRILHKGKVIGVIYGSWHECYIIAPVSGYSANIFLKEDGKLRVKDFWKNGTVTIWQNAEDLSEPDLVGLVENIFNQKDQLKWFSIKPLNAYIEPFTDFAISEFLQQMTVDDERCAKQVWWLLFSIHKDLSTLTGIN